MNSFHSVLEWACVASPELKVGACVAAPPAATAFVNVTCSDARSSGAAPRRLFVMFGRVNPIASVRTLAQRPAALRAGAMQRRYAGGQPSYNEPTGT